MTTDMLASERAKASFSVAKLQELMGSKRGERVDVFKPLFSDPIFDASLDDYRSYKDKFEVKQARASKAMQIMRDNPKLMMAHKAQKVGMRDFFETGALGIHFMAYLPFLQTNASKEQKDEWLDGALNAEYFAAYGQTELGHGSNLRGLETIATFDKSSDEFVIHSPTLTSMKWWPTAIYQCTHAVVFAQLIVEGKNCGVFGFFMQLRDPDGNCMPGVEVGEMGPKLAPNDTGIGYARFNHVRVPRFNMFSKNARVTKEGEFIPAPPKLSKFGYIGMMTIRSSMVAMAGNALATAATIAVRYSCIRKQGFKDSTSDSPLSGGEYVIMDYKIQQYRIFKALSHSFLFIWTSRVVEEFLRSVMAGVAQGDESAADDLPELHATLAGLKALCTSWAANGVEDCRRACGGQGFLRSSGIADLSAQYVGSVTAEGEQMILGLQTARYLIKCVGQVKSGGAKLAKSVKYIGEAPLQPLQLGTYREQTSTMLALLRDRARRVAFDLEADFQESQQSGMTFDEALNSVAVLGYHAAECHCMTVMAQNMLEAVNSKIDDAAVRAVMMRIFELSMLMNIREQGVDFGAVLDSKQQRLVLRRVNELMDELRPDATSIVDGFGFADSALNSTIGRFDGNVYEAIYKEAQQNPLNVPKMVGWEHLAPRMDLDFMRKNMKTQRQGSKL